MTTYITGGIVRRSGYDDGRDRDTIFSILYYHYRSNTHATTWNHFRAIEARRVLWPISSHAQIIVAKSMLYDMNNNWNVIQYFIHLLTCQFAVSCACNHTCQ